MAAADAATTTLGITESQAGLLIIDRMVLARNMYNCVAEVELAPGLAPRTVRAALAEVVAIQPALRERFADLPEPHGMLGCPPGDVPMRVIAGCDDAAVAAVVAEFGGEIMDPQRGPLYRFAYLTGTDRAVLVMLAHHLVFDGYSLRPFLRDLAMALSGQDAGPERGMLRQRREQAFVRELAVHERVAASEQAVRVAREWARELRDVPDALLYPRPYRPVRTARRGERVAWRLGAEGATRLSQACARLDVTPFIVFAGLYGLALSRHTGGTAVIGTPMLARRTAEAYDLSGFFVNTLPVTLPVDWSATADAHLCEVVRTAVATTRARVDVSFNKLVRYVRPERSGDRNPVFSAMLAMQDNPADDLGGVIRAVREHGTGTAKFDAWLGVTPLPGDWLLEFEFDTELLPAAIAGGFMTSLRTALDTFLAAEPGIGVAELFTDASAAESVRTDARWYPPPADELLTWLSDGQAAWPERTAVEEPGVKLSYTALAAAAGSAAAGLRRLGVRPGDVVGLRLDRLTDTVVTMLAILRCGAAYLPLDTTVPAPRLARMLGRAGCGLVIGAPGPAGDQIPARVVSMAQVCEAGPDHADDQVPGTVYVMFSSGSTGEPKGIAMGQRPLLNLTAWQISAFGMGRDTRFLQYAPLGFDVSFQEIVPTLAAGGTVVSREPADRRDFPGLIARIAEAAVTHVYLPVAAIRAFTQAAADGDADLSALRYVCVSGEQLSLDAQIRAFFERWPQCTLVNLYGPTETHAVTTYRLCAAAPEWPAHSPIGSPISNVAAYLVDVTGHLAPPGVAGDLHLGGACPAHGYINQPELTTAAFLPDRFAGAGVMYRTGDQVLRDEAGQLVFLGRTDEQVKIRGYRVELGEIETAAASCPGVRQAVAAARENGEGRELVLFLDTTGETAAPEVIARLRAVLPGYMVPARVSTVGAVPKTANGKVDRDALLRLSVFDQAAPTEPAVYADETEAGLAAMWSRLINVPDLPRDKSLLECGAHSLTVFAALSQVRIEYGISVPIIEFFRTPTIAALAAAIKAGRTTMRR